MLGGPEFLVSVRSTMFSIANPTFLLVDASKMTKIGAAGLIALCSFACSQPEPSVISRQFGICANGYPATGVNIHDDLDSLSGTVSKGKINLSLYIGRHPDYPEELKPAGKVNEVLRERGEYYVTGAKKYILLYSYVSEVPEFKHRVYDEVFVMISTKDDKESIGFAQHFARTLISCPRK
jgi:hypothetical protein